MILIKNRKLYEQGKKEPVKVQANVYLYLCESILFGFTGERNIQDDIMKLTLLQVGKTTDKHLITLIDDYMGRIQHYMSMDVITIPELKNTKSLTTDQQKEKEAELILDALDSSDQVILLDEHGKEMSSMEFSEMMRQKQNTVSRRLVFIIGGPYGFSPRIYERANGKMSLSRMTFSHQMIRLIFTEQVYRALSILAGSPYHHE